MSTFVFRRTQPIAIYVMLLLSTVGAYLLYNHFVVPLFEPDSIVEGPGIDAANYPKIAEDNSHHRWFKPGSWEQEPCSILRTANGKILFQDLKAEDSKTWLVAPFSIVLQRDSDPENPDELLPPIVLRCEKGARLKFAHPVSTSLGGSDFNLKSAELEGHVELYRRTDSQSTNEDLRIETSNILIDDQQIVSINDVAFWFGNNSGIGRNLTIQLSHHSHRSGLTQEFSAINGITNIQLGFLSSMRLHPVEKNTTKDRMLSNDNSPIEVTTAGPFEFNFLKNQARFRDRVVVRKLDPFGDTLRCDELLLKFKSSSDAKAMELDAATDSEFELQSILAQGTPAVLDSNSQAAQVTAQRLQYDLVRQIIKATDPHQVQIAKDENEFIAKSIEYRLTDDQSLGALTAVGPGKLTRDGDDKQFSAHWSQLLTIKRNSDQQHSVTLNGNAQLTLDAKTALSASQIDFSIWEVPVFDQNNDFVRWSYQPEKLVAIDKVHISSEKLIADTQELFANWPANPVVQQQPMQPIGQVESRIATPQALAIYQRKRHQPVTVRRATFQQPVKTTPIMAKGDQIIIDVADRNGETEVVDMQMQGDIQVDKPSHLHPQKSEFQLLGHSLRLIPQGNELLKIYVDGNSNRVAELVSEKIILKGNRLILDQVKNSMWVVGAGQVQLNNSTESASMPGIAQNNTSALTSDRLNVRFDGGMIFNGQNVYFERNVSADIRQYSGSKNLSTHAVGTALRITLDKKINLSELEGSPRQNNPRMSDLVLRESLPTEKIQFKQTNDNPLIETPVSITNQQTDPTGKVIEQFSLASPHVVLNQINNRLQAYGPGSVEIYRRGSQGKQSTGFGFVGDRSIPPDPNRLTYIHTNFDGQLVANTQSNEITIGGNLRSVYSTVSSLNQSFDPDRPSALPAGAVVLTCEQIELIQSDNPLSPKPKSQFIASGNAHILSDTIESTADLISYRDDTDDLVMESKSGKQVLLKVRSDSQSPWNNEVAGSRFIYNMKDKAARISKVGRVSATIKNRP